MHWQVDEYGNEYEPYGNLKLLKKSGKEGYKYVYGPSKSKKRPYQAMIKNERTGKQQGLGSFKTAFEAAVAVAKAIAAGETEDMASPRKQCKRGAPLPSAQSNHHEAKHGRCLSPMHKG